MSRKYVLNGEHDVAISGPCLVFIMLLLFILIDVTTENQCFLYFLNKTVLISPTGFVDSHLHCLKRKLTREQKIGRKLTQHIWCVRLEWCASHVYRSWSAWCSWNSISEMFLEPTEQGTYAVKHLSSITISFRCHCYILMFASSLWQIR